MAWTLTWTGSGPALQRTVTCESCGQGFACELGLAGCWCRQVPLTRAARAQIREQYRECLCPACLKQFQSVQEPVPSAAD